MGVETGDGPFSSMDGSEITEASTMDKSETSLTRMPSSQGRYPDKNHRVPTHAVFRTMFLATLAVVMFHQYRRLATTASSLSLSFFEIHRNASDIFLHDMNLTSTLKCGSHKCFIPSASNPNIGYLVKRTQRKRKSTHDPSSGLEPLTGAWEVANWIQKEMGGQHFHVDDPPFSIALPKELTLKINTLVPASKKKKQKEYFELPQVAVQIMKKAPEYALFLACFGTKAESPYGGALGTFVANVLSSKGVNYTTAVVLKNIETGYEIAKRVFRAKPVLLYDFQAMIDMDGQFYFIDLDGHFSYNPRGFGSNHIREAGSCLEKIGRVKRVLAASIAGHALLNFEGKRPDNITTAGAW